MDELEKLLSDLVSINSINPDLVQGAELAPRVPPLGSQARKPVDLLRIERRRRPAWGALVHGELARCGAMLSRPGRNCCSQPALWLRVRASSRRRGLLRGWRAP